MVSYLIVFLQHRQVDLGIVVAGKSNEAAFAGLLGGFEGLDGAARSEDLLHLVHGAYLVHLP